MHKKRKQPKTQITGIISMTREGFAFLTSQDFEKDIFISAIKLRGALHGDTVSAVILKGNRTGKLRSHSKKNDNSRMDGEVTEIISRSTRPYIGILQIVHNCAWVITDSKNMPYDVMVAGAPPEHHLNGLKVSILVTGWNRKEGAPEGRIEDVLGKPGENNTEMHAILAEFGLPYRFEPEVEADANKIPDQITPHDISERRDCRDVPTFTIDPSDAKDFDDALSVTQLPNGNWEVGVHIADVTHYVQPGSLTDTEASERGTSVYLADRTVPMLPPKLCNQLCSLRPHEDKLTFSALFEIDKRGYPVNWWFGRTIIKSDHRFDYETAQQVIDTGEGPLAKEILILHHLATRLRTERFRKGAISFERPEYKIEIDTQGKPIAIYVKESLPSNWLIEEFMLLANRSVAQYISAIKDAKGKKVQPSFVYRIHEEPNIDKIDSFRTFVTHFGYQLGPTRSPRDLSKELNRLLEKVRDTPQASAIEIMALRSMARARYSTDNLGHYGLAFDHYTHFTSPIRRYPDMMVHRLLAHYLSGGASENKSSIERLCTYHSQREQIATEAERASVKYKMVEFMQDKIGQQYDGTISGLTEWGIYVEINDLHVEGMIPLREIRNDYFTFDPDSYTLLSRSSRRVYRLGDPVTIRVVRANLEQKQLDYALVEG
ncbi:MAG: ribonuclease R [Prevotellaceae bacterium]|jgi:ribonuclease R|nr:ribonuclease R [Prevotellaceae bacterium]